MEQCNMLPQIRSCSHAVNQGGGWMDGGYSEMLAHCSRQSKEIAKLHSFVKLSSFWEPYCACAMTAPMSALDCSTAVVVVVMVL